MNLDEDWTAPKTGPGSEEEQVYKLMLQLDELETLLEELQEQRLGSGTVLPEELSQRISELGLSDAGAIRDEINRLHAELDAMP